MRRSQIAFSSCAALLAAGALLFRPCPAGAATPIASGPPTSLPEYGGAPATPRHVSAPRVPQNPFMAANGRSNVHDDAWMSDTYRGAGPLGESPVVLSSAIGRVCITVTFDRKGRLVATCSSLTGPRLFLFDPATLDTLAELDLPALPAVPGQDATTNSTGGAYFFLDDRDRAVIATAHRHLWIVAEAGTPGAPAFEVQDDIDVSGAVGDDRLTSMLPDWSGNLWFVGRDRGTIGVLDRATGDVRAMRLGEEIENSFAVDRDGVYVVSDRRMLRLGRDASGTPAIVWSETYRNSGVQKVGQFNAGSGTTPTILPGGYVAIADNDDPMNVVVYRTAATLPAGTSRLVCEVPVFRAGAGATENSLIGAGSSLIVENNFGYHAATAVNGALTEPGVTRIDVDRDGRGCHVVWSNDAVRAPSVVPKLSLATGLVYLFTKDPDPVNRTADAWFWTALDFATGDVVWKRLAGTGSGFNNHYAGIVLGPDGTAYVGAIGGLLALRDASASGGGPGRRRVPVPRLPTIAGAPTAR